LRILRWKFVFMYSWFYGICFGSEVFSLVFEIVCIGNGVLIFASGQDYHEVLFLLPVFGSNNNNNNIRKITSKITLCPFITSRLVFWLFPTTIPLFSLSFYPCCKPHENFIFFEHPFLKWMYPVTVWWIDYLHVLKSQKLLDYFCSYSMYL
jgi:hypothetical protein